jgi:hypothetical protein
MKTTTLKCCQLWQTRDQQARRWGATTIITNPVKFVLHMKGGDSREGNNTLMSNINCQGIEN